MKINFAIVILLAALCTAIQAASISTDPYIGAVVMDAKTGVILLEDGADRLCYPASMIKLMDLFIIFDQVKQGRIRLEDPVQITKEVAAIGGSQVYLDPRERFTVDELLYALMIQSANDAAVALANHVAGSREGFVRLMNEKSAALGLSSQTRFHSPHGLPPAKDQQSDTSTARDFATLCRALLQAHPETLKYTSVTFRQFRSGPNPFEMRTHNHLLGTFPGCDGLKTGYFRDAGFSIAATASRDGARIIVVVTGSADRSTRDAKATELLTRFLPMASRVSLPPIAVTAAEEETVVVPVDTTPPATDEEQDQPEAAPRKRGGWLKSIGLVILGAMLYAVVNAEVQRRRRARC